MMPGFKYTAAVSLVMLSLAAPVAAGPHDEPSPRDILDKYSALLVSMPGSGKGVVQTFPSAVLENNNQTSAARPFQQRRKVRKSVTQSKWRIFL